MREREIKIRLKSIFIVVLHGHSLKNVSKKFMYILLLNLHITGLFI
jgi:hypothetical protein